MATLCFFMLIRLQEEEKEGERGGMDGGREGADGDS